MSERDIKEYLTIWKMCLVFFMLRVSSDHGYPSNVNSTSMKYAGKGDSANLALSKDNTISLPIPPKVEKWQHHICFV